MSGDKKLPWMKFFPGDWRSDPGLRTVSFGARGLWADMLCLMHDAEPYGHLTLAGKAMEVDDLAQVLGGKPREISRLLSELEAKNVFDRTAEGVIFSRRMVRDAEKAKADKINGSRGGNPKLRLIQGDKGGVNPPDNRLDNPEDNGGDMARARAARACQRLEAREEKKELPPAAPSERRPPLACRLRDDWFPDDQDMAFAERHQLDAGETFARFRDYWLAKPGAAAKSLDWSATWRNWCRKQAEFDRKHPRTAGHAVGRLDWLLREDA